MTESAIIHGCKNGDRRAFRFLVDQHSDALMGLCMRYLKHKHLAEDALQDSFIRIFQNIVQFDGSGSLGGWMYRITLNVCLRSLQKQDRNVFSLDTIVEPDNSGVQNKAVYDMQAEEIISVINRLPDHYRIVFNLNVIEGYSHKDISEMLDISESLSRTKVSRARTMVQGFFLKNKMLQNAGSRK